MIFDVAESKITDYLLAKPTKSKFFLRFGYSIQDWTRLRDDIWQMVNEYPLTFERDNAYGSKSAIRGIIAAPDGRLINLTTIWMIEPDEPDRGKFLTAYPT
jgi:hypothetical protein